MCDKNDQSLTPTADHSFDSRLRIEHNRKDFQQRINDLKINMEEFAQKLRYAVRTTTNVDDNRSDSANDVSAGSGTSALDIPASTADVLSETMENLSLANNFLDQLRQLYDYLQQQYERHLDNVRQNFAAVDAELRVWWAKCRIAEKTRDHFQAVPNAQHFDEVAFSRYATEIRHWAAFYRCRSSIFDTLNQFEELLNEKAAMNVQTRDATRLTNRGGILIKEEIRRRRLDKELSSRRETLRTAITNWQDQNSAKDPFGIDGQPLLSRLDTYEREYLSKKIVELQEIYLQQRQIQQQGHYCDKNFRGASSIPTPFTQKMSQNMRTIAPVDETNGVMENSTKSRICSIHASVCKKPILVDGKGDFIRPSTGQERSRHISSTNSKLVAGSHQNKATINKQRHHCSVTNLCNKEQSGLASSSMNNSNCGSSFQQRNVVLAQCIPQTGALKKRNGSTTRYCG